MNKPRKSRSPSYPSFALPKAIEHVRRIERDHRAADVYREDATQSMGFTGRSGSSLQALATVLSFGLLDKRGKGVVAVNNRAKAILFAESESERNEAMKEAALGPGIFADLYAKFPGSEPPAQGVVTALRRMGLPEATASKVSKAYLETIACVTNTAESDRSANSFTRSEAQGHDSVPTAEVVPRAVPLQAETEDAEMQLNPVQFTEWMRIPVGVDTTVRILADGPLGGREFAVMMQTLGIQKELLADGSASEPAPIEE